jgi:hypothetical protein
MVCVKPDQDDPSKDSCCPANQACNTFCCQPGEQCGQDGESDAPACCGNPCGPNQECCNSTTGQTCRRLTPAGSETCCSDAEQCGTECCKAELGLTCDRYPSPHCVSPLPTGGFSEPGSIRPLDATRR